MTTHTTGRADSGDIPARFEARTYNLAAQRLRAVEAPIRSTLYGPSPAAETLIIDQRDGALYRYPAPTFTPMSHALGSDAWIGELPIIPWPPTPQPQEEPAQAEERPAGFRPRHRRRIDRLVKAVLVTALVLTAAYTGVVLAAAAVVW